MSATLVRRGEAGIGKTSIFTAAVQQAEGFRVLHVSEPGQWHSSWDRPRCVQPTIIFSKRPVDIATHLSWANVKQPHSLDAPDRSLKVATTSRSGEDLTQDLRLHS
jgi:hypothetical protein